MYGDDFSHPEAESSYKGMEDIIESMKTLYPNMVVKFSTVKEYLKAINTQELELEQFESDFLPFQFNDGSYWSGYYTSDPAFKNRVVQFNNFVRSAHALTTFNVFSLPKNIQLKLRDLQRAQSINFHHDAITGTHNAVVGDDYDKRMVDAIAGITDFIS